jgi:CelD/BcsL family acetyltransferase involved in cellulose biosynthesis
MKYLLARARELEPTHWSRWRDIVEANATLRSPYFAPEFTQAVAAVSPDVLVCALEDDEGVAGFFPFERGRFASGRPVGSPLNDYQGAIADEHVHWKPADLLKACNLSVWEFDHLLVTQRPFARFHRTIAASPGIDVSQGFAAYRAERREWGSSRIAQLQRKARKFEREVGPLRFEPHVQDAATLRTVIEWKSAQCRRTGTFDFFAELPWTRDLVGLLLEQQSTRFAGVLSALYAGDELVAAHFGMRSASVLHWWFPVYNHAFSSYSPGAVLLLRVLEHACKQGLPYVDLGKGDDPYKSSFANHSIALAQGYVTRPSVAASVRQAIDFAQNWVRTSPVCAPVRPRLGAIRRWIRSNHPAAGAIP